MYSKNRYSLYSHHARLIRRKKGCKVTALPRKKLSDIVEGISWVIFRNRTILIKRCKIFKCQIFFECVKSSSEEALKDKLSADKAVVLQDLSTTSDDDEIDTTRTVVLLRLQRNPGLIRT